MTEVEDFLEHYGVRGMKWGVRRKGGTKERVSTERKQADKVLAKVKTHGKKSLTNKEIADFNKRLELETKFNKLNEKPKSTNPFTKGHNYVKALLGVGITANGVYAFSKTPTGKRLISEFEKTMESGRNARYAREAAKRTGKASVHIVKGALGTGARALTP